MHWLTVTSTILYYTVLPLVLLWNATTYLLYCVALPFIYLGNAVVALLALPLNFLAQFEALWYFLSVAIFVGLGSGAAAYAVLRGVSFVFDLDRKSVPLSFPARGHDAASYRAARAEKRRKDDQKRERQALRVRLLASQPMIQEVVRAARSQPIALPSPQRAALLPDVILEHTDEEEESDF